jgi:NADH:ubiquinone oxidoreductase subunit F (NADH-binding)
MAEASAATSRGNAAAGPGPAVPRLLRQPAAPVLGAHLERFGPLPTATRGLIAEVERSGLRGRGGAAFPTAVKLAAVGGRRRAMVVANGTEGEPASAKDKVLLTAAPHLVIDGAVLAARAVGARQAIICVERSATSVVTAVGRALAEREGAGPDPVALRLATLPSRYVAGEESALVHWLNGGDAKPNLVPPRPYERGVDGRPTLVQNVETLAHLALIARFGAAWFRSAGTLSDPGSALLTVTGVAQPGIYEVGLGDPLAGVLRAAATPAGELEAVLIGGYFGSWIPAAALGPLTLDSASLSSAGASLGCGVLAALPRGACGLAESGRVARWLADQSAGQCGPCVHGLDAIAGAMAVLVHGDRDGHALQQLSRWTTMVKGRGACKHPDGAARFVESSLRVFADDIARHRRRGPCPPVQAPVLPTPSPTGWR